MKLNFKIIVNKACQPVDSNISIHKIRFSKKGKRLINQMSTNIINDSITRKYFVFLGDPIITGSEPVEM
jgi:hypothetical protein